MLLLTLKRQLVSSCLRNRSFSAAPCQAAALGRLGCPVSVDRDRHPTLRLAMPGEGFNETNVLLQCRTLKLDNF